MQSERFGEVISALFSCRHDVSRRCVDKLVAEDGLILRCFDGFDGLAVLKLYDCSFSINNRIWQTSTSLSVHDATKDRKTV